MTDNTAIAPLPLSTMMLCLKDFPRLDVFVDHDVDKAQQSTRGDVLTDGLHHLHMSSIEQQPLVDSNCKTATR